jgi:hypothetical protein
MLARKTDQTRFAADVDIARYIADMLCELKQITDGAGCASISALLTIVHRETLATERLSPEKAQFIGDLLLELRDLAEYRGGAQLAGLLDVAHREACDYAQLLRGSAADGWRPSIHKN